MPTGQQTIPHGFRFTETVHINRHFSKWVSVANFQLYPPGLVQRTTERHAEVRILKQKKYTDKMLHG